MIEMKYRKKPVVVEAIQFNNNHAEIFDFVKGDDPRNVLSRTITQNENREIFIETLEGKMKVSPGDYVIKGVQGEFYPCKLDIFEATYEKVED